jgi:hypothetical protein
MSIIRNVITGVVGVGIVSAGAWALDETTRNDQGAIVESGELGVFSFVVGDCITGLGAAGEVESATGVPCTDPHEFEVYSETFLTDSSETLPTDIEAKADEYCYGQFSSFVGLDYESSKLDFTYIYPTEESWAGGDKEITCMITAENQATISESLKNAQR